MQNEWINLLIDVVIAKNYKVITSDRAQLNVAKVDSILVSGLLIRAVSIMDLSLDNYIIDQNLEFASKVKTPRLFDRLKLLESKGLLMDFQNIDKWRKRRNDVGHEIDENYTWSELYSCLDSLFSELKNLNILQSFPQLEIRKTTKRVTPTKEGVTIEQHIIVEVYESDTIYYNFAWKIQV